VGLAVLEMKRTGVSPLRAPQKKETGPMKTRIIFAVAALLTAGALHAQTAQQIGAGRVSYGAMCAGCHAPDLGGAEALQLAGGNFRAAWGTRTARPVTSTPARRSLRISSFPFTVKPKPRVRRTHAPVLISYPAARTYVQRVPALGIGDRDLGPEFVKRLCKELGLDPRRL
jgi:hypothetical protein